ncbi:hypothetical protein, partial [Nocardia sp. NPDC058497]|uniref:hypothetical protein n=1 Tax=Nocardia sp. NPDC058497 TaxID=3346529 RepID=UPI00365F6A80
RPPALTDGRGGAERCIRDRLLNKVGGVGTAWASQARVHLTRQAERVEQSIRADRAFLHARTLLTRVEDPELRDELSKAAIVFALGQSAAATSSGTPKDPLEPARHPVPGQRR